MMEIWSIIATGLIYECLGFYKSMLSYSFNYICYMHCTLFIQSPMHIRTVVSYCACMSGVHMHYSNCMLFRKGGAKTAHTAV